jgi:hypothetical protein
MQQPWKNSRLGIASMRPRFVRNKRLLCVKEEPGEIRRTVVPSADRSRTMPAPKDNLTRNLSTFLKAVLWYCLFYAMKSEKAKVKTKK